MGVRLEEMTRSYWRASLALHGRRDEGAMSPATACRILAALARDRRAERLRCVAGGTLASCRAARGAAILAFPARRSLEGPGEAPCDGEW